MVVTFLCESIGSTLNRLGCSQYPEYFFIKDTFNKLGYKAEINNYTASRIN